MSAFWACAVSGSDLGLRPEVLNEEAVESVGRLLFDSMLHWRPPEASEYTCCRTVRFKTRASP